MRGCRERRGAAQRGSGGHMVVRDDISACRPGPARPRAAGLPWTLDTAMQEYQGDALGVSNQGMTLKMAIAGQNKRHTDGSTEHD